MGRSSDYRQRAADCRKLAAQMMSDEHQRQLLAMAEAWERLAERHNEAVALEERPSFDPRNGG